jgi:hypothetical protein
MHPTMLFSLFLGAISLALGVGADFANLSLAKAHRRGEALHVSKMFLAPFIFNVCGLSMFFVSVQGHNVLLFLIGITLLLILHIFCLSGGPMHR